jgi:hypothetical protein
MANKASATSIRSGYGIKPVEVDGVTVATVLKFAVRKNDLLHIAYWAAFQMHDYNNRPGLYLHEQHHVCKKQSLVRLYCLAKSGQELDLMSIYKEAQVFVREAEIAQFQGKPMPWWYNLFWDREQFRPFPKTDDLPF